MAANNTKIPTVVILLACAIGGIILYYIMGNKRWNWYPHYRMESEDPYGTKIIHDLLKSSKGDQFIDMVDSLPGDLPSDTLNGISSYLFIGQHIFLDSTETDQLIRFIAAGNRAYIFTPDMSNQLVDSLVKRVIAEEATIENEYDNSEETDEDFSQEEDTMYVEESGGEEETYPEDVMYDYSAGPSDLTYHLNDSVIDVGLNDHSVIKRSYPLTLRFEDHISTDSWTYFADELESCEGQPVEVLGSFDAQYPNLIRVRYGKGDLYLHSTPLIFTNYPMMSDTAMEYNRAVLNDTGNGKLYWDEVNHYYDPSSDDYNPEIPKEGPLEFILSESSMRKGWYLILAGALLYLAFGAKRKQRIIPATENMENTSIEYAEVISQLFMKQSDHKKLILLKMDLFKMYLRERFNIRLPLHQKDENQELFAHIAQRSGIKESLIQSIFEQYKYLSVIEGVDTPAMLKFHNKIEEFYFHSR